MPTASPMDNKNWNQVQPTEMCLTKSSECAATRYDYAPLTLRQAAVISEKAWKTVGETTLQEFHPLYHNFKLLYFLSRKDVKYENIITKLLIHSIHFSNLLTN